MSLGSIGRALLVLLLAAAGQVSAQPVRTEHVVAELVAATDAVVPGQPLTVALRLVHDEDWHTYWQVPGDSGLPTQLRWKLPDGFAAGPIEWPVPKRLPVGPLMNFGYEGEVLLPAAMTVPANIVAGKDVTLAARADWLVCKDVCIPDGADLQLTLPVREAAKPGPRAAQIAAARALVPQVAALDDGAVTRSGERVLLRFRPRGEINALEFFPLQEGRIEAAAKQALKRDGQHVALELVLARPVPADFDRLRGVLVANGGPARADRGGWAGVIELPVGAAGASAAAMGASAMASSEGSFTLWLALLGALIGGLLLNLMPCVFPVLSLKLVSLLQHQRVEHQGHVVRTELAKHGLTFTFGVVLSFVALAALLLVLRAGGAQLGWGFQLQTPWVVAALTALFFLIGLNLLGTFEFAFGARLASSDAAQRLQHDRLSGSFWTGVLAVVVAAPCTAPFMGAALGFAMMQPAPATLAVFALLGLGMAAPYLLLTLLPQLLARLPRPGVWMERFKQILAFPMFATCVWLLWVLAQQVDVNAVGLALTALVLLGLTAWAYGLAQRGARAFGWVAAAAGVLAVYAVFAATGSESGRADGAAIAKASGKKTEDGWVAWSRAAVDSELAAGRPVFVDFTAAWCVTCQANKRLVLERNSVRAAFDAKGVVRMRADWTLRDAAITQELARFNRNGVPLYVLYDPRGGTQVLPELLTESILREALARLDAAVSAPPSTAGEVR
ncbi:MAG TPA: thioredoxin family protein [Burkholderiaceae bacterium]|nr:thioredoxin family protein [Burkholderiaceae bacterium]